MRRASRRGSAALALFLLSSASGLPAQAWSNMDEAVALKGVADRARTGYDPVPIPLGPLDVFPTLDAEAGYNDNVRATDSDAFGSAILTFIPRLRLNRSRSASRLDLLLESVNSIVLDEPRENRHDLRALLRYRHALDASSSLHLEADIARQAIDRAHIDDVKDSRSPIRHWRHQAQARLVMSRDGTGLAVTGRLARRTYEAGEGIEGNRIDQGFRDNLLAEAKGEVWQAVTSGVFATMALSGNQRSHDERTLVEGDRVSRNSHGWRIEGGLGLAIPEILSGSISVGHLWQYYSPAFPDVTGVSFSADLTWNPTMLTTLSLSAERRIDDSSSLRQAGRRTTEFVLSIDHALRRNMLLSVGARHTRYDFDEGERKLRQSGFSARGEYAFTQRLSMVGEARFDRRTGQPLEDRFRRLQAMIGIQLSLAGY